MYARDVTAGDHAAPNVFDIHAIKHNYVLYKSMLDKNIIK